MRLYFFSVTIDLNVFKYFCFPKIKLLSALLLLFALLGIQHQGLRCVRQAVYPAVPHTQPEPLLRVQFGLLTSVGG